MTGRLEACIRLAKEVGIKNKRILDVGCSYPWFIDYALKHGAKSASGVEPNAQKVRAAQLQVPSAKIIQGYADKLEFASSSMDIVTLFDVIEHVPAHTELKVFSEINRVMVKGGHLLLSTPNAHPMAQLFDPGWYFGHRHYSVSQLSDLFIQTGFMVQSVQTQGKIWEILGMLVLYVSKWVLRRNMLFEDWIESRRRQEFKETGFTHIMLTARKTTATL